MHCSGHEAAPQGGRPLAKREYKVDMRILVVDDDSVTRLALESLFSRRGFEVLAATDGEKGYELLAQEDAPRIAVVDWALPGMSGLELCRKLRDLDRTRRTHVIMNCASASR